MPRILAIDQGTTSSRAIVFDENAAVLGTGQYEFTQHYPLPGWVEHDAEEIWRTQWQSIEDALKAAGCVAKDIDAIGITNQRETVVVWDRESGEPIAPAIVWQDRRTADFCAKHREEKEPLVRERTGLLLDPYFSGTKLKWLLDHVPMARERAEHGELAFGTIESWLVWKLTGGESHITDASNASRTLLMNLHSIEWDDDLCDWLDIPRSLLPKIVTNSGIVAHTHANVFGASVPISGMAGDQQSALFGQLCVDKGMIKNTYGTGCFLLMQTGTEPVFSDNRLLSTVAWKIGDTCNYALEGSVFTAGAVIQWLRDGLGIIRKSADVDTLAASVEDNGGVYLAPAFTGLGAPHWDPYARGLIAGLTRGSTAAHIARAALESIAFQVGDLIAAMKADTDLPLAEVRVDGGASRSDLLMQFQSDLLDCDIVRSNTAETTARGAAFLAGLGTGIWKNIDTLRDLWQEQDRFQPKGDAEQLNVLKKGWREAIKRSQNWAKDIENDA
jgi:glycerol kinase